MSRRQRLVNLAIAAVIAVVAVVLIVATSGDEDATEREAAATPAPTVTVAPGRTPAATPESTPTPDPVPAVRVKAGEVVGGLQTIRVDEGDKVRFDVTADVDEEVHVHAYDIYKDLAAGKPTRFTFPATITGIIEIELHGSGLQVAELRVEP